MREHLTFQFLLASASTLLLDRILSTLLVQWIVEVPNYQLASYSPAWVRSLEPYR